MSSHKAQVVATNNHIEEDVTLLIEGTTVKCFISYCPYELEVGKTYDVELTLNLSDNYEIERAETIQTLAEHTNRGYSYILYGDLRNDILMTEKYVSGAYDTAIFEFRDPNIRQTLNHIQKEEQQHGESVFKYMESMGLYNPQ